MPGGLAWQAWWRAGKPIITVSPHRFVNNADCLVENNSLNPMRDSDRRKYPRLSQSFHVQVLKKELDLSLQGISVDISQEGAFIKIKNWQSFKVRDHAVVAFCLPPKFTGHDKTIGLQGGAVVARIDKKYKGIAVKFIKKLKQFKPIYVH